MTISEYTYCTEPEDREDYEKNITLNVWWAFTAQLPKEPDYEHNSIDVWYNEDADEIMCLTEDLAEMIANIIEAITGEYDMHTCYYDPDEDARNNEINSCTGWYSVYFEN